MAIEAARGGRPRRTDTPAMIEAKWAWSRSTTVDRLVAVTTHRCCPGTGSVRPRSRSHQKIPAPAAIKTANATARQPMVRVVLDCKALSSREARRSTQLRYVADDAARQHRLLSCE